ncbi:MAG: hypothetical protein KGL19_14445 [Bacteroidota bacterium]|nr:hypothetical protein [Bacteroidota bacterium]
MSSIQVNILNPKAGKLLKNLAELNLISIKESSNDGFLKVVNKLRNKAKDNPPSITEITKEVEAVRQKQYAKKAK